MFKCEICGKIIKTEELNQVFQFTLGNVKSEKFYGEQTLYYHINCLTNSKHKKSEMITFIT